LPDSGKSDSAFRTIGELSAELGVPQHILRYWETRFTQLRPLTRAGNRRYYRPEDVALVRRIDTALNRDGYTIKGVQKLLAGKEVAGPAPSVAAQTDTTGSLISDLSRIRALLAAALAD
jgi:DNA-binding transcriptional MerR regulator